MAKLGEWVWSGACDPNKYCYASTQTFSVGCFQWLATSDGKRLKRGKVVKRFSGPVSDPESVYRQAQAWCDAKNAEAKEAGDGN